MNNETKQTAVEDLETQIEKLRFQGVTEWQCGYQKALNEVLFLLKQAKEMHKQEMIDFGNDLIAQSDINYIGIPNLAEQYYNETYGGNK